MSIFDDDDGSDWQADMAAAERDCLMACEVRTQLERARDNDRPRLTEACEKLLEVLEG